MDIAPLMSHPGCRMRWWRVELGLIMNKAVITFLLSPCMTERMYSAIKRQSMEPLISVISPGNHVKLVYWGADWIGREEGSVLFCDKVHLLFIFTHTAAAAACICVS